jgi:tetratricopeptide (TPR) repeat protein
MRDDLVSALPFLSIHRLSTQAWLSMAQRCGVLFSDQPSNQIFGRNCDMSLPSRPSSLRFLAVWGAISTAIFGPVATPVHAQNPEDTSFSRCDQTKTLQDYWGELRVNPRSSLANYCEGELLFFERNYQASVNAYRSSLKGDGDAKWTKVWSYIQMGKIFDITQQRERAVAEYQLAIQTDDNTGNAIERARDLLQHPFELQQKR